MRWAGGTWWLWGFALLFGFQLLMLVLYPKLILPLFNKLTPLAEGDLRTRLLALADRTGFRAQTIQVMDGSKRSAHSNAFFTGFGRFRRIVLYDTLVAQLAPAELEAVLAHEIGHYKRGHIPKMLAVSAAVLQLGGFALVAWLARSALVQRRLWVSPGRAGADVPAVRAAERTGDVLVLAAAQPRVATARVRGRRLRAEGGRRRRADGGGPAQAGAEKPEPISRRIRSTAAFIIRTRPLVERERALAGD